jgi:putative transposase
MAQSLSRIVVHVIFSTKNRTAVLNDAIRQELYAYMATVLQGLHCPPIEIGGCKDHVHVLCVLSKNMSISDMIKEIKSPTSKWLKSKDPSLDVFYWQTGYGAFSVSESNVEKVQQYIRGQEKHHEKVSFKDEFRAFLKRYNVQFDEEYVWS